MIRDTLLGTLTAVMLFSPLGAQSASDGRIRSRAGNITDLQWSTETRREGDTEINVRTYQSLTGRGPQTLIIEEERRTKTGPNSWSVTKTIFNLDSNGRRRPVERVDAEEKLGSDGSVEVNRAISTPDRNGRFNLIRQEVETSEPIAGGTQSTKTVYEPDINGGMEAVEITDIRETTRRSGQLETHLTVSAQNGQGRWLPVEQRLKVMTPDSEGRPDSEFEQIFRRNSRGKLALSEQVRAEYDRRADGSETWQIETEKAPGGDAKLTLSSRVVTTKKLLADGSEQMVQEVSALKPGQRSEGLSLSSRTITTTRPIDEDKAEVSVEVLAASANGGMRQVSQTSTTVTGRAEKAPGEASPPGS